MQEQLVLQGQRCIGKAFDCNTLAYVNPLFKTRKLTTQNFLNADIKDIPEHSLQSAGNISTSRIIAFLELIPKPISAGFCKICPDEFCQGSRQYIGDLLNWKDRLTKTRETGKQKLVFCIVAADVKAFYPSLCRDTVTKLLIVHWRGIRTSTSRPVKSL